MSFFDFTGLPQCAGSIPTWRETWPFGPGYSEGILSVVLKFAFMALIFLFLAGILRYLFGPGGFMRDDGFTDTKDVKNDAAKSKERSE